jgi:tetratricopeptide (TPR) repeat protein
VEFRDALVVAASVAFVLIIVWRFRPQFSSDPDRPMPKKLATQLEGAPDSAAKASLLFDAGTAALAALRYASAEAYFRRALRVQPNSPELLERVVQALSRRPRGLEALLWRSLSEADFHGANRAVALAALAALVGLHERTPKQRTKAAALRRLLRELDPASPAAVEPSSTLDVSA